MRSLLLALTLAAAAWTGLAACTTPMTASDTSLLGATQRDEIGALFARCTKDHLASFLGLPLTSVYSIQDLDSLDRVDGAQAFFEQKNLLAPPSGGGTDPDLVHCEQAQAFLLGSQTERPQVALTCAVCTHGPFSPAELAKTLSHHHSYMSATFPDERPTAKPDFYAAQLAAVGRGLTAHVFTIVFVGHGALILRTAIVTSKARTGSFVLQLIPLPDAPEELFSGLDALLKPDPVPFINALRKFAGKAQ